MSEGSELITAALLGTDRRPLPGPLGDADPAVLLLDRAARAAVARRAGMILPREPAGALGPPPTLAAAPTAAREILDGLLHRPHADLVNLWLAAAARHGLGLAPQHWASVASVANRMDAISRPLLASTLGERGRWFLRQNAQWSRLASALDRPARDAEPDVVDGVVRGAVLVDPQLVLRAAQPWSIQLTQAALTVIGSVRLRFGTADYAVAVAARMPLSHYPLARMSAQHFHDHVQPGQGSTIVREAFADLESALRVRVEIHNAFETDQIDLDRQELS